MADLDFILAWSPHGCHFLLNSHYSSVSTIQLKSWLLPSVNNTTIKWIRSVSATVNPQSALVSTSWNPRAARKGNLHLLDWVTGPVATRRHSAPVCLWLSVCRGGWECISSLINQNSNNLNNQIGTNRAQGHVETPLLLILPYIYFITLPYTSACKSGPSVLFSNLLICLPVIYSPLMSLSVLHSPYLLIPSCLVVFVFKFPLFSLSSCPFYLSQMVNEAITKHLPVFSFVPWTWNSDSLQLTHKLVSLGRQWHSDTWHPPAKSSIRREEPDFFKKRVKAPYLPYYLCSVPVWVI